jgi:hypothetical protein
MKPIYEVTVKGFSVFSAPNDGTNDDTIRDRFREYCEKNGFKEMFAAWKAEGMPVTERGFNEAPISIGFLGSDFLNGKELRKLDAIRSAVQSPSRSNYFMDSSQ